MQDSWCPPMPFMTLMFFRPVLKQHCLRLNALHRFLASSKVQECVGDSYVHIFSAPGLQKLLFWRRTLWYVENVCLGCGPGHVSCYYCHFPVFCLSQVSVCRLLVQLNSSVHHRFAGPLGQPRYATRVATLPRQPKDVTIGKAQVFGESTAVHPARARMDTRMPCLEKREDEDGWCWMKMRYLIHTSFGRICRYNLVSIYGHNYSWTARRSSQHPQSSRVMMFVGCSVMGQLRCPRNWKLSSPSHHCVLTEWDCSQDEIGYPGISQTKTIIQHI